MEFPAWTILLSVGVLKKTLLSYDFTASVIGICIAGLGYQVLDMFFVRLLF